MKPTPLPSGTTQPANRRVWGILLTLVLALAAGLIHGSLTTGHNWGDDFAGYMGQAKSIVAGDIPGYLEQNELTIRNSRKQIGPVAYPWGYPLLLAAAYPVCGLEVFCLKLLNIPIYLLFLVVLFLLLTRHLTNLEALLITGLFAVNPTFLAYQDNLLSDMPFLLASTLAIWLMDRALFDDRSKNNTMIWILLGAALFLAVFVRTTGILIAATLFAMQLIQILSAAYRMGKFSSAPRAWIPYVVLGALALIARALFPDATGSYLSGLRITWDVISYNLWYYQSRAFYFFSDLPAFLPLSWALLGLAGTGMLLTLRRNLIFTLYTLATLSVYVVWPFPSPRFLFGIAPFLVYFVYAALRFISDRLLKQHPAWRAAVPAILVLALGLYFGGRSAAIVRNNLVNDRVLTEGPYTPDSAEFFAFLRDHTPPEGRIVFFKPRVVSLLTDRAAWIFNRCGTLEGSDFIAVLKDEKYDNPDYDTLQSCRPETTLEIVFENDAFVVYK